MLIFASDLHLSDRAEATPTNVPRFVEAVRRATLRARDEGCKRVALVLLGDVFEFLKTRRWATSGLRPWDPPTEAHEEFARQLLLQIIESNRMFFQGLLALKAECELEIHFVAGNHDALLGTAMGRKACLELDAWGFERGAPWFRERWFDSQHEVYALHGHQFDPYNRYTRGAAFGDAVVIEILVELSRLVGDSIGASEGDLRLGFLDEVSYVDPHTPRAMAAWLQSRLASVSEAIPDGRAVLEAALQAIATRLDELASQVSFETDLVWWSALLRVWRELISDRVDLLKWLSRLPADPVHLKSYAEAAQRELALFRASSGSQHRFVLFGHTHQAEAVALAGAEGVYLNTGTWCRSHRMTTGPATSALVGFRKQEIETLVVIRCPSERATGRHAYELLQSTVGS